MLFESDRPEWERDGRDWPNREASRFVEAAGLRWHVQIMGQGPVLLLLHGTGAATHSWRALLPELAHNFTVVAPDLPGHGFTDLPPYSQLSLPHVSRSVRELLQVLELEPVVAVGHSAGAAIIVRMSLDGGMAPERLISINGALLPFDGTPGLLFPVMAKILFLNPLTPRFFAWRVNRSMIERLIVKTGSEIEPEGIELYQRLLAFPSHCAAALGLMANWELQPVVRDLPRLTAPLLLVVGEKDLAVPPEGAEKVRDMAKAAQIRVLPDVGHLAHEERPGEAAEIITAFARDTAPAL